MFDRSRADWGARAAKSVSKLDWGRVKHLIVHYPARTAPVGTDERTIKAALRGWQDYHMNAKGWTDIAYSVAVDQAGRVWELRGWDRRDGATSGMGGVSLSILIVVGNQEPLSDALKQGVLRVMAEGNRRAPGAKRGWHQQYVQTSCPGAEAIAWGRAGFPAPTAEPLVATTPNETPSVVVVAAGVPAPDYPLDNGCHRHGRDAYFGPRKPESNLRSVSGYYSHREDLRTWQQRMKYRGWALAADGLYGPDTERVARAFQSEKGLAVDGLIGRDTWDAAWTTPTTTA